MPNEARSPAGEDRRPLKTRGQRWVASLAKAMLGAGMTPNAVSVASVLMAALSAAGLVLAGWSDAPGTKVAGYLAAAAFIQLRLLCNMMDGVLAVEGKLGSPSGAIYNELPDRLSDALTIMGAGYAAMAIEGWRAVELAWLATFLAVLTAYIRALGAASGAPQFFQGPMAKPHRMALMTFACVVCAILGAASVPNDLHVLWGGLAIVAAGSLVTCVRRTTRVVAWLEANKKA